MKRKFSFKRIINLFLVLITVNLIIIYYYLDKFVNRNEKTQLVFTKQSNNLSCKIAIITNWSPAYLKPNPKLYINQFSRNLAYSINSNKIFNDNNCFFHIYSLKHYSEYQEHDYYASFVTPIYLNDQPVSIGIEKLSNQIKFNNFTTVLIQHHKDVAPNQWQLLDLANRLPINLKVFFVLHYIKHNPDVEYLGLIRQFSNRATRLIVLSWSSYYSLLHAYGLKKAKLIYIPHGVRFAETYENLLDLNNISSDLKKNDQFVISAPGLINSENEFYRFIRNFQNISKVISNLKYVIVGKEIDTSHSIMKRLFSNIIKMNLTDKIIWIDRILDDVELASLFNKSLAYLSLIDENDQISADLLEYMKYDIPVISTPTRFALEILSKNRGLIVPFQNDSLFINQMIDFLTNKKLILDNIRNAHIYIQNFSWDKISGNYAELLSNTDAQNLSKEFHQDPYGNENFFRKSKGYWNNKEAFTIDNQNLYEILERNGSKDSTYTIYSDFCTQINAKLDKNFQIDILALRIYDYYLVISKKTGVDSLKLKNIQSEKFNISFLHPKIFVETINVKFNIFYSELEVSIRFLQYHLYAHAAGLIGTSIKYKNDLIKNDFNKKIKTVPNEWIILDNDYFSSNNKGQTWLNYDLTSNIFEFEDNYINKFIKKTIKFQIEGQLLTNSGWSTVNRQIFLSLYKNPDVNVIVKCNPLEMRPDEMSIDILVTHHLFLNQLNYAKSYKNLVLKDDFYNENYSFIFRNSYPPYFGPYLKNDIVILNQPWEYYAIPNKWMSFINKDVFEIWVPSNYVKKSFISNGISSDKIQVIPHGVNYKKYQLNHGLFNLPTKKRFKFLTIGGILHRKGIDVLLEAYLSTFTNKHDVSLIIHSIYEFYSKDDFIKNSINITNGPEIIYMKKPLSELDIIRLFKSVDVYVSPYRSEGFGLTILEAMAAGLPVIVTKYGPSEDFCDDESVFFVDSIEKDCFLYPCGNMTIFGHNSSIQARWSEPKLESLKNIMSKVYENQYLLGQKKHKAKLLARKFDWSIITNIIIQRLYNIIKNFNKN